MSELRVFKNDEVRRERSPTDDGHVELQRSVMPEVTGSQLGGGVISGNDTGFDWTVTYDEILFVAEGTLRLTTDSGIAQAHAGDVAWVPRGTKLRYDFVGPTRAFYAVSPAANVPWEKLLES